MSDALTKLAEGERLWAAAQLRPWNIRAQVFEDLRPEDREALIWAVNHSDALLAGMRALVEIASNEPLDIDERLRYLEVQVHREDWKAAQDAVAAFTQEEA